MNTPKTSIGQLVKENREEILRIAAQHGAYNVRIFGSVARGEDGPDSDVDLLVDVGPVHSSWFPAGWIVDLEDLWDALLGCKVDVAEPEGLHWHIREQVLKEAVSL
jgi:predicted nucleotidyltransferase